MEQIPADIYAVKDIGVSAWQEQFWWPIADTEYFELLDMIWGGFEALLVDLEPRLQDLLLGDSSFVGVIGQHFHLTVAEMSCKKNNKKLLLLDLSKRFARPDWASLAKAYEWRPDLYGHWRYELRRALKRIRFNNHLRPDKNAVGLFTKAGCWSLGSFSRLKAEYVKRLRIYCDHPYMETVLGTSLGGTENMQVKAIGRRIQEYFAQIGTYIRSKYGTDCDADKMTRCWMKRIEDLSRIYSTVTNLKQLPDTVLLTEVAKPLHKTLALAIRRRGTRVVGFGHGNEMGNLWNKSIAYNEYCQCDDYVCPSQMSSRWHSLRYAEVGISRLRPTRFLSAETSYYHELMKRCKQMPFPERFTKVMVVGYPMNAMRYDYSPADYFLFQLDLELRVIKLLKQNGLRVIYKMHPERQREAMGVFEALVDEILTEPFEEVYGGADAFFFGCITSTTFGFALCTHKPVFVIDIQGTKWNKDAFDLLQRRCVMISASFDENNRIQFNEELLLKELSKRPEVPDFAYVEKAMK